MLKQISSEVFMSEKITALENRVDELEKQIAELSKPAKVKKEKTLPGVE